MIVNGIQYTERQKDKKRIFDPRRIPEIPQIEWANPAGCFDSNTRYEPMEMPDVDLIKEFELIENKKSNLTKRERDWVVHTFNKKYIKAETPNYIICHPPKNDNDLALRIAIHHAENIVKL